MTTQGPKRASASHFNARRGIATPSPGWPACWNGRAARGGRPTPGIRGGAGRRASGSISTSQAPPLTLCWRPLFGRGRYDRRHHDLPRRCRREPTFGSSATLTATVTAAVPATGTPSGTVEFDDGTIDLGPGTLTITQNTYMATLTTPPLTLGDHGFTAVYSGDDTFDPSTSPSGRRLGDLAPASAGLSDPHRPNDRSK